MKKICVLTGSRADYGLLRWVLAGIAESSLLDLQIIATGMHLSPEFGLTYRNIEADGFIIDRKVEMLLSSDSSAGIAKSIGLGVIGMADAIEELRPDLVLILGDRFEALSAAIAAMTARIPIAHLHGGEVTKGVIDEAIRHSISKMSHLHFVSTDEYRQRVIQLGESVDKVFVTGGFGIDNIHKLKLLDVSALESSLEFKFGKRNLLVTFHPATLSTVDATQQFDELLAALEVLEDTHILFTLPNADTGGRVIFDKIHDFVERHIATAKAFTSMGQIRYLSSMQYVDGVVGNSSSGLIEAPSFKKGTINIGDRQEGRIKAKSVIDCVPERLAIGEAFELLFSVDFQATLDAVENPYGCGGASEKAVSILERVDLEKIIHKHFHDVK